MIMSGLSLYAHVQPLFAVPAQTNPLESKPARVARTNVDSGDHVGFLYLSFQHWCLSSTHGQVLARASRDSRGEQESKFEFDGSVFLSESRLSLWPQTEYS